MKHVRNTSKSEIHPEWLMGGNPDAIEDQEARGQEELCNSSQLPRTDGYKDVRGDYERLGIKVIGKTKDNDLFYDVVLPEGWKINPTEHSMWSDLVDDKGEKVAGVFYKAAFYDRRAIVDIINLR